MQAVLVVKDVGYPWTSDKMMVSCDVCGIGMLCYIDVLFINMKKAFVHSQCIQSKEVDMLVTTIGPDGKRSSFVRGGHKCTYTQNCDFIDLSWIDETGKMRWIGMRKSELEVILGQKEGHIEGSITFDVPIELIK